MSKPCLVVAGGGTSGHINPALSVLQTLEREELPLEVIYVGTESGLEADLVPKAGYPFVPIEAKPLSLRPLALLRALRAYWKGRKTCLKLLKEKKAFAVFATGGYASAPLLGAAKRLGIPRLLHEQNAFPGRNNRLMSRGAEFVGVSYPCTLQAFPKAKRVLLTGNPVRALFFEQERLTARQKLGINPEDKVLLATGGSLGARQINEAVLDYLAYLKNEKGKVQAPDKVILACGKKLYNEVVEGVKQRGLEAFEGFEFAAYIDNMVDYIAASDFVISRAGAGACAELAALGRISFLVPYAHAANDHQRYNAQAFVEAGAGYCVEGEALLPQALQSKLETLMKSPGLRTEAENAARALAKPMAARDLAREILVFYPSSEDRN